MPKPKNEPTVPHINTSDGKRGDVSVRLGFPTGTAGKRRATLEVTCRASNTTILEVDLSPEALMELMGGGDPVLSGARLPVHPERIGRRSQNTSTDITHAALSNDRAVRSGNQFDELAKARATQYLAEGWEEVRIDRTNYGRRVVAYRWIDDDPA